MMRAAAAGLPLSLEGAGGALRIEWSKLACGKDLIRYFSQPCAPTRANGGRTHNLPAYAPERWEAFKAYNARDVEAEMELQQRLSGLQPAPLPMWDEYVLGQRINDRGVLIDPVLVASAIEIDARARVQAEERMRRITGIDNPNSIKQITVWLATRTSRRTASPSRRKATRRRSTARAEPGFVKRRPSPPVGLKGLESASPLET